MNKNIELCNFYKQVASLCIGTNLYIPITSYIHLAIWLHFKYGVTTRLRFHGFCYCAFRKIRMNL